jgi:RimJ/RimL family protein N-acetyltransferase
MVSYRYTAKDGSKLLFREPEEGDAPGLVEFFNPIVAEPRSGLLVNKKVSLRAEKEWLRSRIKEIKKRTTVMLLVEKGGKIKGNCDVSRWHGKCAHVADIGIVLAPELRGMGVGRVLMEKTTALAAERMRGLEIMELKVFSYNDRARKLYESMGFSEAGRIPKGTKEGRDYFDDITMIRPVIRKTKN